MLGDVDLDNGGRSRKKRIALDPRAYRLMAFAIVGLVTFMVAIESIGFVSVSRQQHAQNEARLANRELRLFLLNLEDSETGVRGFLLERRAEFLEPYHSGMRGLQSIPANTSRELDQLSAPRNGDKATFTQTLSALQQLWAAEIDAASDHSADATRELAAVSRGKVMMDSLRANVSSLIASRDGAIARLDKKIDAERNIDFLLIIMGGILTTGTLIYAFDRSIRDASRRNRAVAQGAEASRRTQLLFSMAEMLQSAVDRDDANDVLRASAARLLPGLRGALYCFNNSRDRLDLSTTWSGSEGLDPQDAPAHIAPGSCWALKRGKPHRNGLGVGALRCPHCLPDSVSLEIPMAARGELYGLLELTASGNDAEQLLTDIKQVAGALADAMSLALSSIALREQLRNQALRDPLTGLYNRRFLEEMLDRTVQDAERRRTPLSVVMIDLDHFKMLNDQFGHVTGDAVLRHIATIAITTLNGSDVACRYGGEELAILMPDCSMDMAMAKAEQLRAAIADASKEGRIPPVTASFGVASRPETTVRADDLVSQADAALYAAKHQGRNCVVAAPMRPQTPTLVLAEAR